MKLENPGPNETHTWGGGWLWIGFDVTITLVHAPHFKASAGSLPSSLDGDCTRTPAGSYERNGTGIHTTPDGIIYTGSWKDDKVMLLSLILLGDEWSYVLNDSEHFIISKASLATHSCNGIV